MNGAAYANVVALPQDVGFARAAPTTISKAAVPLDITFSGGAVIDGETVHLVIQDVNPDNDPDTPSSKTFSTSAAGATTVRIDNNITQLQNGAKTMYLYRDKTTAIQQATSAGGSMSSSWYSATVNVTLTD
jgi:hypothetical protein